MKKSCLKILISLFLVNSTFVAQAQTPVSAEVADILQQKLDSCVTAFNVPGISATLLLPEDKYWNGASGVSHIYTQEPMNTSLLFYEASVTKMFVATVILQMAEENLLSLDDEIGMYLDPIQTIPSSTQIKYLLNHRSGLYNFLGNNPNAPETWFSQPDNIWTPKQAIETYNSEPIFNQGAAFSYSNTNYLVLGMIVEQITGNTFAEELRNRILIPYDLNQTFFPHIDNIDGPLVTSWTSWVSNNGPYISDASPILNNCLASMTYTSGALVSCPMDVAKFNRLLFAGEIISESSLELMKTCTNVNLGNGCNGYGYGLMRYNFAGKTYYGHAGDLNGFTQLTIHQEQEGVTLAISINRNNALRGPIALAILTALEQTLGIEKPKSSTYCIYPNPAHRNVNIDFSDFQCTNCKIELYNKLGQRVHFETLNNFTSVHILNLENQVGGVYFLKVSNDNQIKTKKLIIQN